MELDFKPMGTINFLKLAIMEHRKEFRGQYPRLFIVHPNVFTRMAMEEDARIALNSVGDGVTFCGIPLARMRPCPEPSMVCYNGERRAL